MRRAIPFPAAAAIAALLAASLAARADELKLKDGTKITGTIVGFEDNSFKVQTGYGFAIVQKDQVASISISEAAKGTPGKKAVTAKPAKSESAKAPAAEPPAPQNISTASPSAAAPATPVAPPIAKASAPPATPQAPPAAPEPIREEVSGNTYTNDTYGFRMYKPPDWDVIAGARTVLPGAIAAMGTDDQTTYLLIGQQLAGKSVASDIRDAEKRLADIMDDFRPLGEKRITVSGAEATEFRFRGGVDQHDWSGAAVFIHHGPRLFTIFGMTLADSDLVQIQENVIARTIASLQFIQ